MVCFQEYTQREQQQERDKETKRQDRKDLLQEWCRQDSVDLSQADTAASIGETATWLCLSSAKHMSSSCLVTQKKPTRAVHKQQQTGKGRSCLAGCSDYLSPQAQTQYQSHQANHSSTGLHQASQAKQPAGILPRRISPVPYVVAPALFNTWIGKSHQSQALLEHWQNSKQVVCCSESHNRNIHVPCLLKCN